MDLKKRLLRKPLQTILWQVMIIAMALLVGVGGALGYASNRLTAVLDEHHTTIAAQTYYSTIQTHEWRGMTYESETILVDLTQEDIDTLESLDMVEMVDLRTLTGAYVPELTADVALAKWGDLHAMNWDYVAERYLNASYNQVVVTGTVEESWTITEDIGLQYSDLSVLGMGSEVPFTYGYAILAVDEILVMNDEYDIFETEEWSSYCGKVFVQTQIYNESEEDWFQEGQRYIVSGSYDPSCYGLGTTVPHTPDGVMLPWIEVNRPHPGTTSCVPEDGKLVMYTDIEYDVFSYSEGDVEGLSEVLLSVGESFPVVQELEGSTEDFLAEHPEWQKQIDLLEMAQHTFPVLGTQALETMQYFVTNAATITEGRAFTQEEYDSGAKVCVISETMAQSGGIQVGDSISVSQYRVGESYEEGNWKIPEGNAPEEANEPHVGTEPIPFGFTTENEKFTVVGIYRLERSWEDNAFAFTPNTMFMPQKAQIGDGFGGPSYMETVTTMSSFTNLETGEQWKDETTYEDLRIRGVYGVYMSVKLKNGTMEEFQEAIAQTDLADHQFLTYDQGYDAMKENIQAVIDAANKLFLIAAAGWLLLLLLYILLYQSREKRNLGIMRSVGADPAQARRYLFLSGFAPAILGISIGTVASGTVAKLVQDKLITLTLTQAQSSAHSGGIKLDNTILTQMLGQSEISAVGLAILGIAQIVIIAALLWLHAALLAKQNTRKLLGV